jgi:hypothetical protein
MPFVPALGVVASIRLIAYPHWQTWVRFAVWFPIGLRLLRLLLPALRAGRGRQQRPARPLSRA